MYSRKCRHKTDNCCSGVFFLLASVFSLATHSGQPNLKHCWWRGHHIHERNPLFKHNNDTLSEHAQKREKEVHQNFLEERIGNLKVGSVNYSINHSLDNKRYPSNKPEKMAAFIAQFFSNIPRKIFFNHKKERKIKPLARKYAFI